MIVPHPVYAEQCWGLDREPGPTVRIWDDAGRPLAAIDLLAPCSSLHMMTDLIAIATGRAISIFTVG